MIRILIVDDTQGWREYNINIIENIFEEKNIEITTAVSAKDGYDKILFSADNPYDLIITDLQMESDFAPMVAGEWFIKQVQTFSKYLNTKILIVSGMYNIEIIANMLNVDFLPKRTLISGNELTMKLKLQEMNIISKD